MRGLVAVDLRQPRVDHRVGRDETIYVGEPEVATYCVHHRDNRGVHQPAVPERADVELNMGSLDLHQGFKPAGLERQKGC